MKPWLAIAIAAPILAIAGIALFAPEYGYNVLLSLDQHVNTILGGDPDETISSRLGKWLSSDPPRQFMARILCALLDTFDPNHCVESIDITTGGKAVIK